MVHVNNFSYGLVNPLLAYAMSCLGGFLGLRCVTRARAHDRRGRGPWLMLAAVAVGAAGIWVMHFIAMLGFTVPGQQIRYNIPITIGSMLVSVLVTGAGLFIVGYSRSGGLPPVVAGGIIIGFGVAIMHYMGMDGMVMPDTVRYNPFLVVLSVLIAIIAGTAGLFAGTRVHSLRATMAASLIMGVAVTGMHYTGMAAMRLTPGPMTSMTSMSGATAVSFLVPLVLGVGLATFILTLVIALSPTEEEIQEEAHLSRRIQGT